MGRYGEPITYDGVRWNANGRDPYYRNSNRGLLHRWMWTKEVGDIPDGMQVHHKNHDKRDNQVSNFVLLPPGEHWAEHGAERGEDWHAKGGRASVAARVWRDFTCERCSRPFRSRAAAAVVRFCSAACRDHASRTREQRVCRVCGNMFECPARNPTSTCSRRCTSVHAYAQRGKGLRPDR